NYFYSMAKHGIEAKTLHGYGALEKVKSLDNKIAALKICTLLHDPPFKPILLRMQLKGYKKGHKEISKGIIKELSTHLENLKDLIDKHIEDKTIEYADWVASSSDRCLISEFYEEIHEILHASILDISEQKELNYLVDRVSLSELKDKIEKFKDVFATDLKEILPCNTKAPPIHVIYHALWRNLIPLTVKYFNDPNIALLPADTRIPYYTIFDHLYTSSGLIPCLIEGNKIGIIHWEAVGTQSFIKQSRAFRDLWASSFLISLMNTAIIIKLANEYGFDAIINPNMLFNPLVDLYLSSYLKKIKVGFDELRFPTTPDKGFAFIPFSKVDEYIISIPKWINEIWKEISNSIKEYVESKLNELKLYDIYAETLKKYIKERTGNDINPNQLIEIPAENYWDFIWKEVGFDSPIRFVCVGERVDLTPHKIEELLNSYLPIMFRNFRKNDKERLDTVKERIINEIKKIREFVKTKYDVNYQFYEFAIIMEALKIMRKFISEEPRVNLEAWVLRNNINIKDKKAFCNICYSRPAVLFFTNDIKEKIPIKEDERLCPVCLIKRVLATLSIKNEKPDKESPFIKVLLAVFKWIDESKEEEHYLKAIERSVKEYYSELEKVLNDILSKAKLSKNVFEENILAIPSIDTVASMSFRLTAMRCMNEGFDVEVLEKISKIIETLNEPLSSILRDKPPVRWLINKNVLLFFIGGEWFIEEEIRRLAREHNKDIGQTLESLRNLFRNVKNFSKECAEKSNFIIVENIGKYLAIVRADGDNMGMLTSLSGRKYLKKIKELLLPNFNNYIKDIKTYEELIDYTYFATPSYYSMISRTISSLAKEVADVSNKYYCMVIYSGGDDVLALCPPETCLQFSNEIRRIFSNNYLEINDQDIKIIIPGLTKAATQSYTIHLMHIFTPLSKHLEESIIELDKFAKGDDTKNSFIISHTPRGGGKMIAKLPWSISNIVEYILNLVSITLDFPKIIKFDKEQIKVC
ncbi:MAG: type III-B CRISPR-associated protein Cas10/Cmr2, partial [Saccharolobus sp.]